MAVFLANPVEITGLTTGSWQTKDLSGAPWNIPAEASGVMVWAYNSSDSTTWAVRNYGSTDNRLGYIDVYAGENGFAKVTGGVLEYYVTSSSVHIYLIGYFTDDVVWFDNGVSQPGSTAGWATVTCPADVPSGTAAIIVELHSTGSAGARQSGVTGDYESPYSSGSNHYKSFHIIAINGSKEWESYSNATAHTFIVGYITAGRWISAWPGHTPTVDGAFHTITISDHAPILATGAVMIVGGYGNTLTKKWSLRALGASGDLYASCAAGSCVVHYPVALGTGGNIEGKIQNAANYFALVGFFVSPVPPFEMALTGESFPPGTISAEPLAATPSISGPDITLKIDFTSIPLSATSSGEAARVQRINQAPFSSATSISASQSTDIVTSVSFPHFNDYDETDEATPFTIDATFDESNLKGEVSFPTFEVESELLGGGLFDADMTLPKATVSSTFPDSFFDVDVSVPKFTVESELVALEFNADVSFPTFSVSSDLVPQNDFDVAITLPAAFVSSFLDGSASAQTHKAVVMNVSNHAVTEYPGFGFNSFCTFNGVDLGAITGAGIYALSGDKDVTKKINAEVVTGMVDTHKDVVRKQIEAWLTGRTKGELKLTVHLNEGVLYEYPFDRIRHKIDELRAKVGKGIKQRFAEFWIKNVNGADFDIDSLKIDGEPVPRKTR